MEKEVRQDTGEFWKQHDDISDTLTWTSFSDTPASLDFSRRSDTGDLAEERFASFRHHGEPRLDGFKGFVKRQTKKFRRLCKAFQPKNPLVEESKVTFSVEDDLNRAILRMAEVLIRKRYVKGKALRANSILWTRDQLKFQTTSKKSGHILRVTIDFESCDNPAITKVCMRRSKIDRETPGEQYEQLFVRLYGRLRHLYLSETHHYPSWYVIPSNDRSSKYYT